MLNAGIQRQVDFTSPSGISLSSITAELTINYLSPLHTLTLFLPHLQSLSSMASIILLSSGLALVPIPSVPNYCASKSALHSLAWTQRAQLADDDHSRHIRVIEIMPPAVQTELHTLQPELVKAGRANIGIPLAECLDEAWDALDRGDDDEIPISAIKSRFAAVEVERKAAFQQLIVMMKGQTPLRRAKV